MTSSPDTDLLRQKTFLLLKRDREHLALQQRFARAAGWLATGERLAREASRGDRAALEAAWPTALVERLQFQCAMLVELGDGPPRVRTAAGSLPPGAEGVAPPPEALAALEAAQSGAFNGHGEHPLARLLGLRRFLWAAVGPARGGPLLAVAGFGERTWQFFPDLTDEDLAYFRMVCRQLEALAGQADSIAGLTVANAALRDRTAELSEALVALKDTQEQLVHREKLAALGQMAAGVAHEINNPACYVRTNLSELSGRLAQAADRELAELAKDALDGINRVVELTRDLTAFARQDREPTAAPVALAEVVQAAERLVRNRLRHQATVHLELEGRPEVLGHQGRLTQVFVNLLVNALQALPQERPHADNVVRVTTRLQHGRAIVTVGDNGVGMAPEILSRVFEPFYTTKLRGTGLGLGIAKQIVDSHDGAIAVESELGRGTTFTVTIPALERRPGDGARPAALAATAAPSPPPPAPVPAADAPRRMRVLVVDDDPSVARATARLIRQRCEVVLATSGLEALDLLARGAAFDAVVCDLMMPGMSGAALHGEVAVRFPAMAGRFVFVSGGAFTGAVKEFSVRRDIRLVGKPFEAEELLALLAEATALPA